MRILPVVSAGIWRADLKQCLLLSSALRLLLLIVSFVESSTMSTDAPNVPAVA